MVVSGTIGEVDGTSTSVIWVSSIGGGMMLVDGASLRIDVCVVLLLWALSPLVRTPSN